MTKETEEIFKALGNANRLRIVRLLLGGELSCGELSRRFKLSQPTMSRHFNILLNSGIITERRQGTQRFYALNRPLLRRHGISLQGN